MTDYIANQWQEDYLTTKLTELNFTLKKGEEAISHRTYFDSFSHDLESGQFRLFLEDSFLKLAMFGEVQESISNLHPENKSWKDFPDCMIKDVLKVKMPLRCLLKQSEFKFIHSSYAILNEDDKTVARLEIQRTEYSQLPVKLSLMSLRGYESEFEETEKLLLQNVTGLGSIDWLTETRDVQGNKYNQDMPADALDPQGALRPSVSKIILDLLKTVRENESGVIEDLDTEFLHDYRVNYKKVRSLLSLIRAVYPSEDTKRWKSIIKVIISTTDHLRDLDSLLQGEQEYKNALPISLHKGLQPMLNDLRKQRYEALREVIISIKSPANKQRYEGLCQAFEDSHKLPESKNSGKPLQEMIKNTIYKRYRKVSKLGKMIEGNSKDEILLELRLEFKKLLYLLEFFGELFPADEIKKIVSSFNRTQTYLEKFKDFTIQQDYMLDYLNNKSKVSRELSLSVGGLIVALKNKQDQARSEIADQLFEINNTDMNKLFKTLFRKGGIQ